MVETTQNRQHYLRLFIVFVAVFSLVGAVAAQEEETPTPVPVPIMTMNVGQPITIDVPASAAESGVAISLIVETSSLVNIKVTGTAEDGTNPQFALLMNSGREMVVIDDNPGAVVTANPSDAVYENLFLIPGSYILVVQRTDTETVDTRFEVSVETTDGELPGLGQIDIVEGFLEPFTHYQLPVTFNAGDYISVAATGLDGSIDLQLMLLNAEGEVQLENDDNETGTDLLLDFIDPKLEQVIVPADGQYTIEVGGYSPEETGPFKLIISRFGTLDENSGTTETFAGDSLYRGRNTFTFEGEAGEIIGITARAAQGSSMDPEIQLLDPDLIYIASNDDHQTEAEDLAEFDALVSGVILQKTGTYTLDINSIGGKGAFEVTLERLGKFAPGDYEPIDQSAGQYIAVEDVESE